MEVADQWRREWAGTAEYGKVTEGGVTRRIARAMEVLHASGPGARVKVMRAAYHSSAGPGAPAASFMLHSSRRVISSGFNLGVPFLESPATPNKPLEISSTPLESSPEPNMETENYKVTEPDDFEISEPSKWRGSTRGSSIRMPSEESSSTDNASIIDLDARLGRNLHRKYSYDSETSDIQCSSRNNNRASPLLDTPVTLSTLKYKSLLNSTNEWNTRRKSYSFEDTSPLSDTILDSNDTLAMESSTDSGICKSTEIVNDHMDDSTHTKNLSKDDRKSFKNDESFRDWLSKNRPNSHYRGTKFKTYREHDIVMEEDPADHNITLQSSGKVLITLPITVESDGDSKNNLVNEESERKVKRVEFCKTEVHFAAESGKVNIIATDEKPPPSTDFRKRRSAFVPMQDMIEKPITLFGETTSFSASKEISTSLNLSSSEFGESDENTAATKSILKNKIPKPKPYLLGENMVFGMSGDRSLSNKDSCNDSTLTAVSLVNKQLGLEKQYNGEVKSDFLRETDTVMKSNVFRTIDAGPTKNDRLKNEKHVVTHIKINKATDTIDDVKNKLNGLQVSPVQRKPKTRQLRDSDLTYFGVDNDRKDKHKDQNSQKSNVGRSDNVIDNIFQSVKLIQQVSNSVCTSESEDTPDYQNIPLNINYAPVPTPRLRSKYDDKPNEIKVLKPIIEKEREDTKNVSLSTRRAKTRKQDDITTIRSISAPPKAFRRNSMEKSHRRQDQSIYSSQHPSVEGNTIKDVEMISATNKKRTQKDNIPIYVNLNITIEKPKSSANKDIQILKTNSLDSRQRKSYLTDLSRKQTERTSDAPTSDYSNKELLKDRRSDSGTDSSIKTKHSVHKDTLSRSAYKDTITRRTEKTDKSRSTTDSRGNDEHNTLRNARKSRDGKTTNEQNTTIEKKDCRNKSSQRSKIVSEDIPRDINLMKAEQERKVSLDENRDASNIRKRNSSRDKNNSMREILKSTLKQDPSIVWNSVAQSKRAEINHGSKAQSKSNESKYSLKPSRGNKRKEYVINYDDKNGTVSSICKITPSLGTPKRKKLPKEIFKDSTHDKALKYKSVDKIVPRK